MELTSVKASLSPLNQCLGFSQVMPYTNNARFISELSNKLV